MSLTREQVWAQLAALANNIRGKTPVTQARWDAYYEALTLIGPEPLVLVDRDRPYGRIHHPTLGDPAKIPGMIAG